MHACYWNMNYFASKFVEKFDHITWSKEESTLSSTGYSCNMGMRAFPYTYVCPRATGPRAEGIHIRQSPNAPCYS